MAPAHNGGNIHNGLPQPKPSNEPQNNAGDELFALIERQQVVINSLHDRIAELNSKLRDVEQIVLLNHSVLARAENGKTAVESR